MNFDEMSAEFSKVVMTEILGAKSPKEAGFTIDRLYQSQLRKAYEAGKAEASELVSALEFYAEERHHNDDVWSSGTKLDDSTMEKDWGKRAREALKKWRCDEL